MADYDSSLPVRSEADGNDERLHVKLVDYTNPDTQQAQVNTDSELLVEVHGKNPASGDETLRLSELGAVNPDGDYDVTNNTKPASIGIIASDRGASVTETSQNLRPTGVSGDSNKIALDVAISDSSGNDIDSGNPLPVSVAPSTGTKIHDYNTTASVAKDASTNHDYSIADTNVLSISGFHASGSGKIKVELLVGDGAVSEVFTTKAVYFNSTADPNIKVDFYGIPLQATGTTNTTTIRLTITNLDNQPQDVYSTLIGNEV